MPYDLKKNEKRLFFFTLTVTVVLPSLQSDKPEQIVKIQSALIESSLPLHLHFWRLTILYGH